MYSKPEIQNKTISSAYKTNFCRTDRHFGTGTLELSEQSTQRRADHQTAQQFRYPRRDRQGRS
jgi:hypothetical protein